MNEKELLKQIPKKNSRNGNTKKYGMFGLSLGPKTYDKLNKYCEKHNINKSTLVRALVVEYLQNTETNIVDNTALDITMQEQINDKEKN